jgi:hypothetical protein
VEADDVRLGQQLLETEAADAVLRLELGVAGHLVVGETRKPKARARGHRAADPAQADQAEVLPRKGGDERPVPAPPARIVWSLWTTLRVRASRSAKVCSATLS